MIKTLSQIFSVLGILLLFFIVPTNVFSQAESCAPPGTIIGSCSGPNSCWDQLRIDVFNCGEVGGSCSSWVAIGNPNCEDCQLGGCQTISNVCASSNSCTCIATDPHNPAICTQCGWEGSSCTNGYCSACGNKSCCGPGAGCTCGGWSDQGCGAGGCAAGEMYQTRSCAPAGCSSESQCVSSSSCSACSGGICQVIQGFKVMMPGNVAAEPAASQLVTVSGSGSSGSSATNPYFLAAGDPGGSKTVSVSVPAGHDVGYTLCIDSTGCHGAVPTPGSSVTFDCTCGSYADLWWHYTPIPADNPPTCSVDGPPNVDERTSATYTVTPSDPDGDLTQAEIYVSPTSNDVWDNIYTGPGSGSGAYTFPSPGTYYVECNAHDAAGNQCSGNPWCEWTPNPPSTYNCGASGWVDCTANDVMIVTVNSTTPAAPILSATLVCSPEEVDLVWNSVLYATEYRVERCTGVGCVGYTEIATVAGTTYTDSTVLNSTTYRYRVRGYNGTSSSPFGAYSNEEQVDVVCVGCTIDINQLTYTVSVGSTDLVLTGYTEDNGTINNVSFSIDPAIASVCQDGTGPCLPPTGVWVDGTRTLFWADLTGVAIGGPTTLTAVATMDDFITTCQDTAQVTVGNAGNWWQVKEGDVVTATGIITSTIPATCTPPTCDPFFITIDLGDFPGVPTCDSLGCSSFGAGNVSDDPPGGWIAEDSEYSSTQIYDYDFFAGRIPSTTVTKDPGLTFDIATRASVAADSGGYHWFVSPGPILIITNPSNVSEFSEKVIVFVDGDVTIMDSITVDNGVGSFTLIVSGSINIDPNVAGDTLDDTTPELEGLYFANVSISTGTLGANLDTGLHVRGSVVANTFSLDRDLVDNSGRPGEIFEYGPDQAIFFHPELVPLRTIWREVAP